MDLAGRSAMINKKRQGSREVEKRPLSQVLEIFSDFI
jgi:hypothetical protein